MPEVTNARCLILLILLAIVTTRERRILLHIEGRFLYRCGWLLTHLSNQRVTVYIYLSLSFFRLSFFRLSFFRVLFIVAPRDRVALQILLRVRYTRGTFEELTACLSFLQLIYSLIYPLFAFRYVGGIWREVGRLTAKGWHFIYFLVRVLILLFRKCWHQMVEDQVALFMSRIDIVWNVFSFGNALKSKSEFVLIGLKMDHFFWRLVSKTVVLWNFRNLIFIPRMLNSLFFWYLLNINHCRFGGLFNGPIFLLTRYGFKGLYLKLTLVKSVRFVILWMVLYLWTRLGMFLHHFVH